MQELGIQSISSESLTVKVRDQLSQLITSQALNPGDKLPSEANLAEQFGVSKTVIREALRGLAAQGVVEIHQGKLATVRTPSHEPLKSFLKFAIQSKPEGLREALELRRTLEKDIAMIAAERISNDEVEKLECAVEKMSETIGTVEPWVQADVEFHLTLAKSANNRLMLFLVEALRELFHESILLLHTQRLDRDLTATLERHKNIVKAIKDRDPEAARNMMQVHFDATEPDMLLAVMKAQKARTSR